MSARRWRIGCSAAAVLLAAGLGLGGLPSAVVAPQGVGPCGAETDCVIGERTYRIRMPSGHDGETPVGAIVFSHGYRGSARGVMANKALGKLADALGVAVIAGKSSGDDWALPGAPSDNGGDRADEVAYYDRVIDDAARRFKIDTERLLATGFSAGGMMTWTLACHRSGRFAGFAPIAGTFWQPAPRGCTTPPASIIHIHGDADRVVPLKGRKIGKAHQSNVLRVLDMYARYGSYEATGTLQSGELSCDLSRNAEGKRLEFCMFSGGHSFRTEHLRMAWERLMSDER